MISPAKKPFGRIPASLALAAALFISLGTGQTAAQDRPDPDVLKNLAAAKSALQTAVDTWDAGLMAEARDRFLGSSAFISCRLRESR